MANTQARSIYDESDILSCRNDEASTISKGMVVKRGVAQDGCLLFDAVTDEPLGITQNDVLTGQWCTLQKSGRAPVLIGATVAVGDKLMPHATNGKLIVWTASADDNAAFCAIANQAGVDGDLIEADLRMYMRQG